VVAPDGPGPLAPQTITPTTTPTTVGPGPSPTTPAPPS
jgi:hypothetical protein